MKKALLTLCLVLASVQVGFAAKPAPTPSFGTLSMLKGTYAFQGHNTKINTWSASKRCNLYDVVNMSQVWNTDGTRAGWVWVSTTTFSNMFTFGGSEISQEFQYGTMTFDGLGGISGSGTAHHAMDQTSSNNTVSITCGAPPPITICSSSQCVNNWGNTTGNNGYVVYLPDSTISLPGSSYTVVSDGSGMLELAVGGGKISDMYMQIGGPPAVTTGPWTTILFFEWGSASGPCNDCGLGTAVLQQ